MLKHVQISPLRNRSDSVSLRSSISCASSLCGSPEPPAADPLRPVSRASSYCSLSENQQPPQTTIKIFTACLRIDIEYKTLGIQWDTSSKEVVAQLLRRCKLRQRDPRLFYLTMEVQVRRAGVRTLLALEDTARPATLQASHPKGESRFCLQMKPGGLIKVHTQALQPTSQYKSLLIAEQTTADELLLLLLASLNSAEPVEHYSLYEVCAGQEYQRKLHPDDQPLRAQLQRSQRGESCHFLVRKNPHYPRRRQLLPPIIEQTAIPVAPVHPAADPTPSSAPEAGIEMKTGPAAANVCKMCRNTFRSCEFCNKPQPSAASSAAQLRHSFLLPAVSRNTEYSPVYNVREIRAVCHSFSALGLDRSRMERQQMGILPGTLIRNAANSVSASLASPKAKQTPAADATKEEAEAEDAAKPATTINRGSVILEAVHNDPANGFGKFVYI